jgi:hypothetical protein
MPAQQSFRSLGLAMLCSWAVPALANIVLVQFNSHWKYLDDGSNQGTAWRASVFPAESTWATGFGEFGYGDDDERSVVSYGPNASAKHITTYFRKSFNLANAAAFSGYQLQFRRDDGLVIYVNGVEVARSNMPTGTIGYTTLASTSISSPAESAINTVTIASSFFQSGTNVIAVEVHQNAASSSDLTFDLKLVGVDAGPSLTRGPYQHIVTSNSFVLKWRTATATNARVRYGATPGALDQVADVAASTLDHEVTVTGLQPSTTYYYAIGTSSGDLEGDDVEHFVRTTPLPGVAEPIRIWVLGDHGTANADQRRVRDAYLNHMGSTTAQAWLWLGDNAYESGTEAEHQPAVFENMYEATLRTTPLYPAPGNHDYYSGADATTGTGPYFDLFVLPKNGQAGGVASNSEAYFSFDVGNVHFISLDSYDSPRSPTGAQAVWLTNDLIEARKRSEWIIAYWHHPPYSKGADDSDDPAASGGLLKDMRENFLPILEADGVDLVLGGHTHNYQRSFLINGHHGISTTYNAATMGLNTTSGSALGPGAYQKPGDLAPQAGTVYTVCGVSGKKETGGSMNPPVMHLSTATHLGSMVIDVNGTSLQAIFLNDHGTIVDRFDIVKGPTHVKLAAKVLLEGAYDPGSGLMRDDLRVASLIPSAQPHTGVFPLVGEGGLGTVAAPVLAVSGANAIVDWVFVELRDKAAPSTVLASRSALVQRDGDIVDTDGVSPVLFTAPVNQYHVAVRHRNHLGAMTSQPVLLSREALPLDFSNSGLVTWGVEARKSINGTMVLWAGNSAVDGILKYTGDGNDRDPVLVRIGGSVPTNMAQGYEATDINLNGEVKYTGDGNDRDPILVNIGGSVPTATRSEQLP